MKKILLAIMVAAMCCAFAGCGGNTDTEETTQPETTAETTTEATVESTETTAYSYVKELSSDTGFDMEVKSIALTTEGDIIMQTEGDLADAVGGQVTIASGMKDAYVEPFGNGGFYTILMIKEDGTVSAVNTMKLREEKTVELMDNLGGLEDVASIEGDVTEDAHVVYAVQGNGEKTMLDPYLQ